MGITRVDHPEHKCSYLAASGHNLYTKSARVYLQQMANLKEEHRYVRQRFDDGLHDIRRSNRGESPVGRTVIGSDHRAGSDEKHEDQRRAKTRTGDDGATAPVVAAANDIQVNQAMQELTGANCKTLEPTKDMNKARQTRDWKDTLVFVQYLEGRNPFSNDPSLRNIAIGVHAHLTVNVDTAHTVRAAIMKSMEGKTGDEHPSGEKTKLSLSAQSHLFISMERKSGLIHRLIIVAKTSDEL